MSSHFNNRFADSDSPYNSREVSRAKASLKTDVEMGALRYLSKKLSCSGSSSFPNVWDGEGQFSDYFKDTFPMPMKFGEEDSGRDEESRSSHSVGTSSGSSSTSLIHPNDSGQDGHQTSNSSSLLDSSSLSEKTEGKHTKNRIVFSQSDEDDNDCVILEQEKEIIEIEDDDNDSESISSSSSESHSNNVLSNGESIQWQLIVALEKDIMIAKDNFRKINKKFRTNKNVEKACWDMTILHQRMTELTDQLAEIKNDIDIHSVSSESEDISKKCLRRKTFKENYQIYHHAWCLLNTLCREFVRVRKRRKAILMAFEQFLLLSPSKIMNKINKIRRKKIKTLQ